MVRKYKGIMRRLLFQGVFFYACTQIAKGLLCHECHGDPTECERSPRVAVCQSFPDDHNSDQVCATSYNWSNGEATVTKGCKARKSCYDDASQSSNRCNEYDGFDKSCRCCCEEDNCNRLKKGCVVNSECPELLAPTNGFIHCDSTRSVGSVCNFTCQTSFELIGPKKSTCLQNRDTGRLVWDNTRQSCIAPIRCNPIIQKPKNGEIRCENSIRNKEKEGFNYPGSKCSFRCNTGFRISGSAISKCRRDGQWSRESPKCVPRQCRRFERRPNRIDGCTNDVNFGSICIFECMRGFQLQGHNFTVCQSGDKPFNKLQWTNEPPTCQIATCQPPLTNPTNGEVLCTDENSQGSVCTYVCDLGYDIDQSSLQSVTTVCLLNGTETVGKWTNPPAVCKPVKCWPPSDSILNGQVECTNSNHAGSQCKYTCDKGYDLDHTTYNEVVSECFDDMNGNDVGLWTLNPPPTCSPITCQPTLKRPSNGDVVCSKGDRLGSVCTFTCNLLYDMVGTLRNTLTSKCVDDGDNDNTGRWSRETPKCRLITCPALKVPENGFLVCTNATTLSSKCKFQCDPGYELHGNDLLSCEDKERNGNGMAVWSSAPPVCRRIYCSFQYYDNATLNRQCHGQDEPNRFPAGSSCSYSCKTGHFSLFQRNNSGRVNWNVFTVECMHSKHWSFDPPRCFPVVCDQITLPSNGRDVKCTNHRMYGSECTIKCSESHRLSDSRPLICVSDGDESDGKGIWNRQPPFCLKNECGRLPETPFGQISYTRNLNIGSTAQITCNSGYTTLRFGGSSVCTIGNGAMGEPRWLNADSLCCVQCQSNKQIKLILLLDKTVASNNGDWRGIIDRTVVILDTLFVDEYRINFGVIVYDTKVDEMNSKPLQILRQRHEIHQLRLALYSVELGGQASDTGKEMDNALNDMFSERTYEEPFAIFVSGMIDVSSHYRRLIEQNINVIRLQFVQNGVGLPRTRLQPFSENKENVEPIRSTEDAVRIAQQISEEAVARGCQKASERKDCPDLSTNKR